MSALVSSIPAHVAGQIVAKLDDVATMLRAMRDLAANANEDQYEAVSVAVSGLSERSHLIIDACIQKMGGIGLGNYRDDDFEMLPIVAAEEGTA